MSRPVLRYTGGKFNVKDWIISFFPRHEIYTECFGGSASILMNKEKAKTEVYNDINSTIYEVFTVLRNKKKNESLANKLFFTPWSRQEFNEAYIINEEDDDVERARKTIVRSFMASMSGGATRKGNMGFKSQVDKEDYKCHSAKSFFNFYKLLPVFYNRLREVILENTEAKKVISLYDTDKTLHYVDPPYVHSTWNKSDKNIYGAFYDNKDHEGLLNFLKELQGYVILSGYDNELYNDLLPGWHKEQKETTNTLNQKRIETLWISPKTWEKLNYRKSLFE